MEVISTPVNTSTKNYYAALTGVRAVAAYMVVFFHFNPWQAERSATSINWLDQFISTWSVGVTVFFVLSGFLITARYVDTIELKPSWWRRYLQNRVARILPVYLLLTGISFLLIQTVPSVAPSIWSYATWKDKLAILLLNLTLLRAYFEKLYLVGLPTAWSLTVEETFYLCAPLLLLGACRNWRLLLLYPILLLSAGLLLVKVGHGLPYGFMATIEQMLSYTFFGRCTEFIVGMGLGLLVRRGVSPSISSHYTLLGGLSFLSVLLLMVGVNVHLTPAAPGTSLPFIVLFLFVLPLAVASLFWGLVHENTALSRFLSLSLLQMLGKISYVLYLIHLGPLDSLFTQHVSANMWVKVVTYTFASYLLYTFVEHPLQARLRAKK